MKRFFLFSASVLCLSIAVLILLGIGSQSIMAIDMSNIQYFHVREDGDVNVYAAILPNGDVYTNSWLWTEGSSFQQPSEYVGNFWQGIMELDSNNPPEINYYFARDPGDRSVLTAVLLNGDVYINAWTGGNSFQGQSEFIGNFWNGVVATEQSSWGSIKGK